MGRRVSVAIFSLIFLELNRCLARPNREWHLFGLANLEVDASIGMFANFIFGEGSLTFLV